MTGNEVTTLTQINGRRGIDLNAEQRESKRNRRATYYAQ